LLQPSRAAISLLETRSPERARRPLATTRPLCGRRSRVAKRGRFVREAFALPLGVRAVQRGAMPASRAFFTRKAMVAFAMMKRALRSEAGGRPSCAARPPPGPNRRSPASRCGRAAPGRCCAAGIGVT
jgi:hypothetical protein